MEPKYIVAIEIGSSQIKGAIGAVDDFRTLKVIAIERRETIDCVRYGCIQNVEEVRQVVADIILSLEARVNIAPRKVKAVYVSLGGRSMTSYKRNLEMSFDEETEITNDVINQLLDEARMEQFSDKEIVDVLPMDFVVDTKKQTKPIGTYGQNLKVPINIIACRPQIIKNLNRVIEEKLKLSINDCIVRQMAIAQLVLTPKEIQSGCVLVDFGAETTTVSIHKSDTLQSLVTIPLGSRNITRDITTLGITEDCAEKIKCESINVTPQDNASASSLKLDNVDDADVYNMALYRAGEIVANITAQITDFNYKVSDLPGGIIVVGRGAKLKGFNSVLHSYSSFNVRIGMIPEKIQIADNDIHPNDDVDVVAILYAAIQSNQDAIVECLSIPMVEPSEEEEDDIVEISSNPINISSVEMDGEEEQVEDDDEQIEDIELDEEIDELDEDDDDNDGYNEDGKPKEGNSLGGYKRIYQSFVDKLNTLLSEPTDEDEEDDNDGDNEK